MNILLISYLFPPVVNPQGILSARIAKYLRVAGHTVTVVAATDVEKFNSSHGVDASLIADLEAVRIHYVADREEKGVVSALVRRLISHERSGYWVDKCVHDILPDCSSGRFDVVYSLTYPMASNLLGMKLKRLTGIPWVAHFSDPGFLAYNRRFKSPVRTHLTRATEMNIFRYADGITFVNEETLQRNTRFNPAYREKCKVIPHMFDPDYFRAAHEGPEGPRPLRLSYVGSLYGKRNPFNAIRALQDAIAATGQSATGVELHIYGSIDPAIRERLDAEHQVPWLKLHGPISYGASLQAMRECDYLVLIDWSSEDNLFFPSKLVDYLAACRPIIGITPLTSYSAQLLGQLEYPALDSQDVAGMTHWFSRLLSGIRVEMAARHAEVLAEFRADHVVGRLAEFLASKVRGRGGMPGVGSA